MKKLKIYLDNCCFNRPYDDLEQEKVKLEAEAKLAIQKQIYKGNYDLVWSYILAFEVENSPFFKRKIAIKKWKDLAKEYVAEHNEIIVLAGSIINTGIKFYDAYHLACSIYAKCDYFITVDKQLLKYKTNEIKIVTPLEFVDKELN